MYKKKLHSLVILIPSYNELENLKKFLLTYFAIAKHDVNPGDSIPNKFIQLYLLTFFL